MCLPLLQYTFRVDTPSGWSDSFTFGFETQELAYKWHDAISAVLRDLRGKAGLSEDTHHHHYHSRSSLPSAPTTPTASTTSPAAPGAAVGAVPSNGSAHSSGSGVGGGTLHLSMRGMSRSTSPTDLRSMAMREDSEAMEAVGAAAGGGGGEEQVDELGELWNFKLGTRSSAGRRWIPCKHCNGVAIYQHQLSADGQGEGEYMVGSRWGGGGWLDLV